MNFRDYLTNWKISLEDYEKGGWGSSTKSFVVPQRYNKYYRTDRTKPETYDKNRAFEEIVITFCDAIVHKYRNLFLKTDLFDYALWPGVVLEDALIGTDTINIEILNNISDNLPQVGASIIIKEQTYEISEVNNFATNKYIFTLTTTLIENVFSGTEIYVQDKTNYIYFSFTRENVIKAIYLGIAHSSNNNQFWEQLQDTSIRGPLYSFGPSLTDWLTTDDALGIRGRIALDNAMLNSYEIVEINGIKTLLYDGEIRYASSNFEIKDYRELDERLDIIEYHLDNSFIFDINNKTVTLKEDVKLYSTTAITTIAILDNEYVNWGSIKNWSRFLDGNTRLVDVNIIKDGTQTTIGNSTGSSRAVFRNDGTTFLQGTTIALQGLVELKNDLYIGIAASGSERIKTENWDEVAYLDFEHAHWKFIKDYIESQETFFQDGKTQPKDINFEKLIVAPHTIFLTSNSNEYGISLDDNGLIKLGEGLDITEATQRLTIDEVSGYKLVSNNSVDVTLAPEQFGAFKHLKTNLTLKDGTRLEQIDIRTNGVGTSFWSPDTTITPHKYFELNKDLSIGFNLEGNATIDSPFKFGYYDTGSGLPTSYNKEHFIHAGYISNNYKKVFTTGNIADYFTQIKAAIGKGDRVLYIQVGQALEWRRYEIMTYDNSNGAIIAVYCESLQSGITRADIKGYSLAVGVGELHIFETSLNLPTSITKETNNA